MHARSALFDLWGDHLLSRGGEAPVSALVRMLAALDISEPAVRTAVSRMLRQGWLVAARTPDGPGYALTDRARARLDDAARRIYRTTDAEAWDGHWHLVLLPHLRSRSGRDRVRAAMGFLGYAPLHGDSWIAPRPAPDLAASLAAEGVRARAFDAVPDGGIDAPDIAAPDAPDVAEPARALASAVWDLDRLAADYERWCEQACAWVDEAGPDADDEQQFAARSRLVHEWRKFLFTDPALPSQLLPADWPGRAAAELFDRESARLAPAASRFVDSCMPTAEEKS